jgi:hypothetical protein
MTDKILTFDVETVPQKQWRDPETLRERDFAPGEWPEDETISSNGADMAFEIQEGKLRLAGTRQLPACHPSTAHVVSVSFGWLNQKGELKTKTFQPSTIDKESYPWDEYEEGAKRAVEARVLEKCWDFYARAAHAEPYVPIVGFNSKLFDLPMIRIRSAVLGVPVPRLNWYEHTYVYRNQEHIDLRLVLSDGDRRAAGSLAWWARAFGIEAEESGAEVLDWALAGEWGQIERYGVQEMQTLVDLYQVLKGVL